VGAAGDEEQKPTVEVKHNDSHTTNHSTGDSQNSSSSAEKARQEEAESSSDSEEAGCVPNESLKSFITGSPFSFRNPIFFSMPRDH